MFDSRLQFSTVMQAFDAPQRCLYVNLDEIHINSFGMCSDCEMATIPHETLNAYKEKRLDIINKFWDEYDNQKT